jgi:drug/metabolite transporter (DMT)-like permease
MRKFNVMPLGTWFFDLLENIVIVILLSVYPIQPTALAWILVLLTTVKWFFAGGSILLILVGLIMAIKNGFRKQE